MVLSCEKGSGVRSIEICGGHGSAREKESRKTKDNLERKDTVKRDFEVLGADESAPLDRRRWRKIIASPTPI